MSKQQSIEHTKETKKRTDLRRRHRGVRKAPKKRLRVVLQRQVRRAARGVQGALGEVFVDSVDFLRHDGVALVEEVQTLLADSLELRGALVVLRFR